MQAFSYLRLFTNPDPMKMDSAENGGNAGQSFLSRIYRTFSLNRFFCVFCPQAGHTVRRRMDAKKGPVFSHRAFFASSD